MGKRRKINKRDLLKPEKLPAGQMEEFYALQRRLLRNDFEHMRRVRALSFARAPLVAVPGGYVGLPNDILPYYSRKRGYY